MPNQISPPLTRRTLISGLAAGAAALLLPGNKQLSTAVPDAQLFIRAMPRIENVDGRPHVIVGGHAEVDGPGHLPRLTLGVWRSATARDQTLSRISAPSHVVLSPDRMALVLGTMERGQEVDFEVAYPLGEPQGRPVGQFTFIAGTRDQGFRAPLLAAKSYPTWVESPPHQITIDDASVSGP